MTGDQMTSETGNIRSVGLHPEFPKKVWVIVEQPRNEPYRFSYDPASKTFIRTTYKSLLFDRGFSGVYGWIGGSGTPPEPHYDVMLLTKQNPHAGDILLGYICGVFFRRDGDHKFVAMDAELKHKVTTADLAALDKATYNELMRLYPGVCENEGWYGAEVAFAHLKNKKPTHN
jgi:inorganic pyrophosphatase